MTSLDVRDALGALRRRVDDLERSLSIPEMSDPLDATDVIARLDCLTRDLDAFRSGNGFNTTNSVSPTTDQGSSEYSTKPLSNL